MPHYKLTYFPVRGKGEMIRLLLHYVKQPYEDVIVKKEDWSKIKPNFPFGQLPVKNIIANCIPDLQVFEVDGKQIAQSYAITRYLARQYNLTGVDDFEAAQVDAIADEHSDFEADIRPFFLAFLKGSNESEINAEKERTFVPAIHKFLPIYEKLLKESASGFFVKSGVTWVDFVIVDRLNWMKKIAPEAFSKYKVVLEYIDRFYNLPQIKDYIAKRPETTV